MSRFLKIVVNIILICAIVVAGGLLIPPFAGVTTVIVDEPDMDTNLAKGAVAYAVNAQADAFHSGDKVLISEGASQYVYEITGTDGEKFVLEDKLSTDGGMTERTLGNTARKVVLIVPFIGYLSMALRTTEGLIIVGLAVIFIIILFILAEIWKKDDDEEESEEDGEEPDSEENQEEEPVLSRRQQKKAAKKEQKEEKKQKKLEARAAKKRKKKVEAEEEPEEPEAPETVMQEEPEVTQDLSAAIGNEQEPGDGNDGKAGTMPEQDLFAETRDLFAADIADILQGNFVSGTDNATAEHTTVENVATDNPAAKDTQTDASKEEAKPQSKKLAMPIYTKEELLRKAQAAGDEPKIVEDEYSGVTLLDYSDIL